MRTLFSFLIIAMVLMPLAAQEVRPVKDDVGFCWNAASMKTLVDDLEARKTIALDSGKKISGTLFRYSDTYSEGALPLTKLGMGTTAPFSLRHWVSFCSIGYYLE